MTSAKEKLGRHMVTLVCMPRYFERKLNFTTILILSSKKMIVTKGGPQESGPSLYPVYSFTAPSVIPLTKYFWKNG